MPRCRSVTPWRSARLQFWLTICWGLGMFFGVNSALGIASGDVTPLAVRRPSGLLPLLQRRASGRAALWDFCIAPASGAPWLTEDVVL